jgi:hypothetical protein
MDIHKQLSKLGGDIADIKDIPETLEGQVWVAGLTKHDVQREEKRLHAIYKRLNRKKYTRKPGHVHPKKKAATLRRRRMKRWREDPYWCVIYRRGRYELDRKVWDKHIAPLWTVYDPDDLTIISPKRDYVTKELLGTRVNPYTVYKLRVEHKTKGIVWEGHDQLLYDLSCTSEVLPSE